ncbi:hypothetical protein [Oceanobacillus kimchii]
MKIYSFNQQYGQFITHFDSIFTMTRILQTNHETRIGCMHLDNNGIIGYHQASVDQLLLVVNGDGWVRTSDTD